MSDTDEPTPAAVARDKGLLLLFEIIISFIALYIIINKHINSHPGGNTSTARLETLPSSMRNVRACLLCSLVKTVDQFEADGCDNCEQVLMLKHDDQRVSVISLLELII
jgi:hypothetical protein